VKVLLVGSGGREHALASALARSELCDELHAVPGNPGIAEIATCHPLRLEDREGVLDLATTLRPGLTVIGPEAPLVAGLADDLRHLGLAVFGPGRQAARLEGSKAFAKDVMEAAGVPTARHVACTSAAEVEAALAEIPSGCVVKADGLAAGKGVVVCDTAEEAAAAARSMLEGAFGEAGRSLVIEERLVGEEVSLLALCDGGDCVPLAPAQDYKRIGDDDQGPNTGGMGAYSPVPGVPSPAELADQVHLPVLYELERRGIRFSGCLYAGLMLTAEGPKVLEFNVRFGDPETQVLVPRLNGDLCAALLATAEGRLRPDLLSVSDDACVGIVLASAGYPASPRIGDPIEGVEAACQTDGVEVFHAGTARVQGQLVTAGGRVLNVSARGRTLQEARERAYAAAEQITFDGRQLRSDIAQRAVEREAGHARA
jgi:phosphoribosylamine---glycine ligase